MSRDTRPSHHVRRTLIKIMPAIFKQPVTIAMAASLPIRTYIVYVIPDLATYSVTLTEKKQLGQWETSVLTD